MKNLVHNMRVLLGEAADSGLSSEDAKNFGKKVFADATSADKLYQQSYELARKVLDDVTLVAATIRMGQGPEAVQTFSAMQKVIVKARADIEKHQVSPYNEALLQLANVMGLAVNHMDRMAKDPEAAGSPASAKKKAAPLARLMASVTPGIRSLAKKTAKKIGNDIPKAAALVWMVLEDVNAHTAANKVYLALQDLVPDTAKAGKSPTEEAVRELVGPISSSRAVDFGVVQAAAFGIALLQEVGGPTSIADMLAKEFDEFT